MREKLRPQQLSLENRALRGLWSVVWFLLFRPSPRSLHAWRRFLLRLFGAQIGHGAHPYPSARIWAPWNLVMEEHSCLAEQVDCYSVATVHIGAYATVSQYSFLCTASHDYSRLSMPLVAAPIVIGKRAWVAADVFIGPGVTVGEGTVVFARSSVFDNLPEWVLAGGHPAVPYRKRTMSGDEAVPTQEESTP
jgi:putative colanic acid biosynthesis acetyltransferase WcaF